MRIRTKPWARPELYACDYFIEQPEQCKGKWNQLFSKNQPLHLELGCGKGVFISELAYQNPNINYLAVDERLQHTSLLEDKKYYYGDVILRDCEKRILQIREEIGIAFVTLYSTEEGYHLYHDRNCYEDFEDDMSTFVAERDKSCHKLYKWIDDIVP